jgi:hypothetical protein
VPPPQSGGRGRGGEGGIGSFGRGGIGAIGGINSIGGGLRGGAANNPAEGWFNGIDLGSMDKNEIKEWLKDWAPEIASGAGTLLGLPTPPSKLISKIPGLGREGKDAMPGESGYGMTGRTGQPAYGNSIFNWGNQFQMPGRTVNQDVIPGASGYGTTVGQNTDTYVPDYTRAMGLPGRSGEGSAAAYAGDLGFGGGLRRRGRGIMGSRGQATRIKHAAGGEVMLNMGDVQAPVAPGGIAGIQNEYTEMPENTQQPMQPMQQATQQAPAEPSQEDITMLAGALLGKAEGNADKIVEGFIQKYGNELFLIFRQMILEQSTPNAQTAGMIEGQGGGMDDQVQGTIGGQQPVAVSPGEYIVPADVVSGLGDGSSDAGARELDAMMDRTRMARGGNTTQPPPFDARRVLPK